MKQILLLIILSLWVCPAFAQNINSQNKEVAVTEAYATLNSYTTKLSPSTAILLLQLKRGKSSTDEAIVKEYSILVKNKVEYIHAFLVSKTNTDFSSVGFIQQNKINNIRTGLIELSKLEELAIHPDIEYLEISSKAIPALNNANAQTRVDLVHQGHNLTQAYTGEGVVVGIIDIGFDYTHPAFFDSTGSISRIKRVWETKNQTGNPPAGYFYGTELVGDSAIFYAFTDDDYSSHGTHVAGIAAGSGFGTNGAYRGVAFNSDLVLVSFGGGSSDILDGIKYIMDYAESVNKPCVINLSIASHSGPHDGTSLFDQACEALVDTGKILVGAAANNGQDSIYIEKEFGLNDTLIYTFLAEPYRNPTTRIYGNIDIWGEPNDSFKIALHIYNTLSNTTISKTPYFEVPGSATSLIQLSDKDSISPDICQINISCEVNAINNKPHIYISIFNNDQDDVHKIVMLEVISKDAKTKMWTYPARFIDLGYSEPFMRGSTKSTVGEIGGTGKRIITAGAYTSKNSFKNLSNVNQTIQPFLAEGDIALFSSKGPTADNRTKPDVSAPGNILVAPINSFDPTYGFSNPNLVFGMGTTMKNYYYAAAGGTSMASPMVAGIVALWLEADPSLTYNRIMQLIKNTSINDTYTGSIPLSGNNTWGWGKIDAYNGLLNVVGIEETKLDPSLISIYPNPNSGELILHSKDANALEIQIYDLQGRAVLAHTQINPGINSLNLSHLENGIYFLQYIKSGGLYTKKIILSK